MLLRIETQVELLVLEVCGYSLIPATHEAGGFTLSTLHDPLGTKHYPLSTKHDPLGTKR